MDGLEDNSMIGKILKHMRLLPAWCTEIRVTRDDVLGALEFWDEFNVPMPHVLKKVRTKLKKDKKYKITLWDQIVIARAILAQIAAKTEDVFQDEMFSDIATECAQSLAKANKYDV
jgi:hypothetical protein